jgi:hypothetical protein
MRERHRCTAGGRTHLNRLALPSPGEVSGYWRACPHAQWDDIVDRETAPVKSALSGPNREPRSQTVVLIGCQSVRLWSSFLGLRTVVRA